MNFCQKSSSKIGILVKNMSKIDIFIKNANSHQNPAFIKNPDFGQKSRLWPKIDNYVKNRI